MTPELALELFKAGGLPLLLIAFVLFNRAKSEKAETPKSNPAEKLADEMSNLNRSITDLRSELAELGGFIKGRMK